MSFFPSSVPTALQLLDARNNKSVTLTSAINDVVTTIPVADTSDIPTAGYLTFEDGSNECIQYTGVTPTSLTGVTRGSDGTTASSHSNGGTIGMWGNAKYHNVLSEEIVAITQNLSDRLGLSATQIIAPVGVVGAPTYTFLGDLDTGIWHGGADRIDFSNGGVNTLTVDGSSATWAVRLLAPNGSAVAPAYSFSGEAIGMYRVGALTLGWSIGSTLVLQLDNAYLDLTGNTYLKVPAGSVTAPVIANRNNLDTGFYWSTGTQLTFTCDGSNVLSFLHTNSVDWGLILHAGYIHNTDGTAASPAYSFDSDTNTGFYRPSSDAIALSTGGGLKWTFTAIGGITANGTDGNIYTSDGTASLPAHSFVNDSNIGMYRISEDNIGFSTGGVLRVTINNSGLTVNSGTLSGTFTFADGSAASPSFAFTADTNTGFYRDSADSFYATAGGTQIARFRYSGTSAQFAVGSGSVTEPSLCIAGNLSHGFYRIPGLDVTGSSVPLAVSNGTAAEPSYGWANNLTCGLYRSASNQISMSIIGGEVFRWDTNGVRIISGYHLEMGTNSQIHAADGTAALPSISFQNDPNTGIYSLGADQVAFSAGGARRADYGTTYWRFLVDIDPNGPASNDMGDATNYWNEINYKTLTDRGCLPWCDDGVELVDGTRVSDLDAICSIQKHPTQLTVHGLPKLDYRTFPKKAYRPADRDGDLIERDANNEPVEGQDGIEMTMMFGVMIGAFKQLKKENDELKSRLATLEA